MVNKIKFKMCGKMTLEHLHGFIGAAIKDNGKDLYVEFQIKEYKKVRLSLK